MKYRCNDCKVEIIMDVNARVTLTRCPVCLLFRDNEGNLKIVPDPPDRLDAIRKRAEALGLETESLDSWNVLTGAYRALEVELSILEKKNQRQDRKEVTE